MEPYLRQTQHIARPAFDERIGDAERAAACDQLSAAFAAGQLDSVELDDRLARAVAARTRSDLGLLLTDLGPGAQTTLPPPKAPAWSGQDLLALLVLITSAVVISGMLLVVGAVNAAYFVGCLTGGTLAFAAGVSTTHLVQRFLRRTREAARAEQR